MSDKYSNTQSAIQNLFATLRSLASGTIEAVKLSAAERLTLLLAAIAVAGLATILVTAVVLFVSIGVARALESVTPHGAYFMVAGFYALLLILLYVFRRPLVVDPISRLITRLLLDPPEDDGDVASSVPTESTSTDTPDYDRTIEQ